MRALWMSALLSLGVSAAAAAEEAPRSLRGTTLDCHGLRFVGVSVRPDVGLRRCLDHCLTLEGELALPAIRRLFIDEARAQHRRRAIRGAGGGPAPKALGAMFDAYLAYREAEAAAMAHAPYPFKGAAALKFLDRLEALQRRWLGPKAAEGMLGADQRARRRAIGAPGQPMASTTPARAMMAIEIHDALERWARDRVPAKIQRQRLEKMAGPKAAERLAPLIKAVPSHR